MLRRRFKPRAAAAGTLHVPTPGTVVALELVDVDRVWRSQIEEQQGASLVVLAPYRPGGLPILPEADRLVTIGWPSQIGYLEADCVVTSTDDGEFPSWSVNVLGSALSQRRSAYRLDDRCEASLFVEGHGELEAVTRNIAEGGIACDLRGRHDFEVGERLGVRLSLPESIIEGRGRIVRAAAMVPDGSEVVIAFENLPEETAERLRQHVFEQQLARRSAER